MTPDQLGVLSDILRLAPTTRAGVRLVLLGGLTHQAAADSSGATRPMITRALSRIADIDQRIRAAWQPRQRAAGRPDDRT